MNKDLVGQTLLNQFRVDAFVESGGMATVYRVWDLKRNVSLAMKVLHADLAEEPAVLRRFQREANALKRLTHPHIVPFYGLYQTSDSIFLLERFVDGYSLKELLRKQRGKPLDIGETLIYFNALCASLGYAHANGIVHCDVKPGNVMVDVSGSIYLTDFGIARYSESTTTSLGTVGTSAYMAPEQIRGETVSPATDVYALGVMLFEFLTGKRPFMGTEPTTGRVGKTINEQIRYGHLHVPPPDPRLLNSALSETMANVILRSLNKKPEDRYQSTQELIEAISQAAQMNIGAIPERVSPYRPLVVQQQTNQIVVPAAAHPQRSAIYQKSVPFLFGGGILVLILWIIFGRGAPMGFISTQLFTPTKTLVPFTATTRPPTHTPIPTRTPVTPSPSSASAEINCAEASPPRIREGDVVEVIRLGLPLRSLPEISQGRELSKLTRGTKLKIHGTPECSQDPDTGTWYWIWEVRIRNTDIRGFVAEGDSSGYFIEPVR